MSDYREKHPVDDSIEELEGVKSLKNTIKLLDDVGNGIAYLFTFGQFGRPIPKFANGGTPQKGSLFIAGEAGAELVGDLGNGGTSVVNKKQAKQLGIPMYANGVNVPKWTPFEQEKSSRMSTHAGGNEITDTMNVISDGYKDLFTVLGSKIQKTSFFKTLKSGGTAIGNFAKTAFDVVKDAGLFMWEGVSNSKAFKGTIDILDKFKDVVKGVLNIYKDAGKVVVNFYEAFKSDDVRAIMSTTPKGGGSSEQQQGVMSDLVGNLLGDSTVGLVFSLMQDVNDGMLTSFIQSLPQFVQAGMDMFKSLIQGVVEALPELLEKIPEVINTIVGLLTNKDSLNTIIQGLVDMVVQIAIALPDILFALTEAIPDVIMTLIDLFIQNLPMFIKLGVVIASAIVEGLINTIISGVNALIKLINKIPFVDIPLLKAPNFTKNIAETMGFADGGYPMQGQMFIAREAGAELVGNIGGRTGVMNNEQIITSVSRGVYEAVSQAMAEQGKRETVVNLDGKRVSNRLDVANRNRGVTYGMGGY